MLLAVDIGNSSISVGLFDLTALQGGRPTLNLRVKMAADRQKSADEYAMTLLALLSAGGYRPDDITAAVIGSVVPPLTHTVRIAVDRLTAPVRGELPLPVTVMGSGVRTGIGLLVDEPSALGADIVANATAAVWLYGAPVIIVDFGTATVLSAVNANRALVGVSIAPGLHTALESLRTSAARIPYIELGVPGQILGRNTADSTRSGLVYGTACMVDGLIDRIPAEAHLPPDTPVVGTGGLLSLVASHCRHTLVEEPDLTLLGLWRVFSLTGEREGRKAKNPL